MTFLIPESSDLSKKDEFWIVGDKFGNRVRISRRTGEILPYEADPSVSSNTHSASPMTIEEAWNLAERQIAEKRRRQQSKASEHLETVNLPASLNEEPGSGVPPTVAGPPNEVADISQRSFYNSGIADLHGLAAAHDLLGSPPPAPRRQQPSFRDRNRAWSSDFLNAIRGTDLHRQLTQPGAGTRRQIVHKGHAPYTEGNGTPANQPVHLAQYQSATSTSSTGDRGEPTSHVSGGTGHQSVPVSQSTTPTENKHSRSRGGPRQTWPAQRPSFFRDLNDYNPAGRVEDRLGWELRREIPEDRDRALEKWEALFFNLYQESYLLDDHTSARQLAREYGSILGTYYAQYTSGHVGEPRIDQIYGFVQVSDRPEFLRGFISGINSGDAINRSVEEAVLPAGVPLHASLLVRQYRKSAQNLSGFPEVPDRLPKDLKLQLKRAISEHGDEEALEAGLQAIYTNVRPFKDEFPELVGVNPHYVAGAEHGTNINCASCVNAAVRRLTGKEPQATAENMTQYGSRNDLLPSIPFGFRKARVAPSEVVSELRTKGDGAYAVISIPQKGDLEHAIIAVNRMNQIHFIDPQLGAIVKLKDNLRIKVGYP